MTMHNIDEARRVAADLLREAGDEMGARVLEKAGVLLDHLHHARTNYTSAYRDRQWAFHLCAYLEPAWADAEVERAHGEAVEMEAARARYGDDE